MPTLEWVNNHAADLYRVAFLLTGDRERSVNVAIGALDSHHATNSFFSKWMLAWSRKVVIARVLATIRNDLASSARRTAFRRTGEIAGSSRDLVLDPNTTTRAQIDSALLAVEVFPRSALILTLFEGLSVEDAAVLLDEEPDLVRKAQIIGLWEMTSNLAGIKRQTRCPIGCAGQEKRRA